MTTPSGLTLRVRIAEAQGWTKRALVPFREHQWISPEGKVVLLPQLPDWPNSLDLCAQLESGLTPQQSEYYAFHLMDGMNIPHALRNKWRCYFLMTTATARQRCLAYLATINPEKGK